MPGGQPVSQAQIDQAVHSINPQDGTRLMSEHPETRGAVQAAALRAGNFSLYHEASQPPGNPGAVPVTAATTPSLAEVQQTIGQAQAAKQAADAAKAPQPDPTTAGQPEVDAWNNSVAVQGAAAQEASKAEQAIAAHLRPAQQAGPAQLD